MFLPFVTSLLLLCLCSEVVFWRLRVQWRSNSGGRTCWRPWDDWIQSMLVWLSSWVKTISSLTHTTTSIYLSLNAVLPDVHTFTGNPSVFISLPRTVWQTEQRAGVEAQSKRRVPAAHLPPGGGAVCGAPWHPGQDAGEGCHHCEWARHKQSQTNCGDCIWNVIVLN